MKKTAAILILALPALLLADINRLRPDPGEFADDTRAWRLPRLERSNLAQAYGPPAGSVMFPAAEPRLGLAPSQCTASGPARSAVCTSQPDCRGSAGWPVNWMVQRTPAEGVTIHAERAAMRGQAYQPRQPAASQTR